MAAEIEEHLRLTGLGDEFVQRRPDLPAVIAEQRRRIGEAEVRRHGVKKRHVRGGEEISGGAVGVDATIRPDLLDEADLEEFEDSFPADDSDALSAQLMQVKRELFEIRELLTTT